MSFVIPKEYVLVKEQSLPEIQSVGYLLSHKKTGAKILCVENADDNKVFSIAFRTTPKDSTGVAHIIEHTVLCGSDKYPAKDPFVELVKGSLNTFLNAITYPDKTVYPVASCNMQDFKNLMSVYMDAVFYPNIYKNPMFFEQEGWHYEMEDENSPLIYNGVVYNEMKGAYSSPDGVLEEEIMKALYPDNAYAKDSGGYPLDIPNLTYEQFLDFHRTYYHPSNSFIYLYGDMDMEERLSWIDAEYLSHYDHLELDSMVALQEPFKEIKNTSAYYSIGENESEENNSYLAWARSVGTGLDMAENTAYALLAYVLFGAPGAPVKQALVDAGIGADIYGYYEDNVRQPYFVIIAKGADTSQAEQFREIINSTLERLINEGLSKKSLLAGLNDMEFRAKEADFGGYPKGLIYGLNCLSRWLYDDMAAFETMAFQKTYDTLRETIKTDYFEKLIQTKLLDNTHGANILLAPKKGYAKEMEKALTDKLAAIRESLSDEQIRQIVEHTKALKKFQETPSTEEELEMIPMLSVDDVKKKTAPLYIKEKKLGEVMAVHHELFSGGISYINLEFDGHGLTGEDIPYASLLQMFLGMVSTENYSYKDLGDEIMIKTGGIASALNIYCDKDNNSIVKLEMSLKVLPAQLKDGLGLLEEIILRSDFSDQKRIRELISKAKARLSTTILERGDLIAATRAFSYYAEDACLVDLKGGVAFYQFLEDLDANFDERIKGFTLRLNEVLKKLVSRKNLLVSFTGEEKDYERFAKQSEALMGSLPDVEVAESPWNLTFEKKNEGFKTASQVNYIARCGNYKLEDPEMKYTGVLRVLKVWMTYEYLWVNIRVKGGAYGCGAQFLRNGDVCMTSFRDPKCAVTSQVFLDAADVVEKLELSDRDLTKYILGAINELDAPLTPAKKGSVSLTAYLTGITVEDMQKTRDQVLATTLDDLRALAVYLRKAMERDCICAVGNATQIEADKDIFKTVTEMFH